MRITTLKDYVKALVQPGEKFIEITPYCMMRLMPDGSAILYKNNLAKLHEMVLSRRDLEVIKTIALPVPIFTPELEENRDVHTEHCCVIHGCKYGHDDCPVTTDVKRQSHACEQCYNDSEGWCGWREEEEKI